MHILATLQVVEVCLEHEIDMHLRLLNLGVVQAVLVSEQQPVDMTSLIRKDARTVIVWARSMG